MQAEWGDAHSSEVGSVTLWIMTPFSLVGVYQRFGEAYVKVGAVC
jgi:hypothetical protein